jgi:hypothetical protein
VRVSQTNRSRTQEVHLPGNEMSQGGGTRLFLSSSSICSTGTPMPSCVGLPLGWPFEFLHLITLRRWR